MILIAPNDLAVSAAINSGNNFALGRSRPATKITVRVELNHRFFIRKLMLR